MSSDSVIIKYFNVKLISIWAQFFSLSFPWLPGRIKIIFYDFTLVNKNLFTILSIFKVFAKRVGF